ncbi:unnamed protein product [Caenorhabditis auriculariae]|uniref:OCIA domain-containing protein n=1 Tax=Caenorhabditis auriculariae TaxID=2777116 RepID=A0A8S1H6C9_9PELO|nr:unnamed protein product [Caenorhabditis auriculariae]
MADISSPSSSNSRLQLNNEQLQYLFNKMSSDEQKELTDIMKNCTTEMATTRGLPATALVLGSLYFARTRLPPQYQFGPKGWPFYVIMGIGSMTVANLFSMGTCRDRVQPKVAELWEKYKLSKSRVNYDDLRRQNRQTAENANTTHIPTSRVYDPYSTPIPEVAEVRGPAQLSHEAPVMKDSYAAAFASNPYSFDMTGGAPADSGKYGGSSGYSYPNDGEAYMSGTPSGHNRDRSYS